MIGDNERPSSSELEGALEKALPPSGYNIDKALKEKQADALEEKKFRVNGAAVNEQEFVNALIESDINPVALPEEPEDQVSILDQLLIAQDPTLSDVEKSLTEKQRKFAWHYAKMQITGVGSKIGCAIEAGYAESGASKEAYKLLRNPLVMQVVKDRMPVEKRLAGLSKEFLVDKFLTIAARAMQEVPVKNKKGEATGYFVADDNVAIRALSEVADIMGYKQKTVKLGGADDGQPISVDSRSVTLSPLDMASLIKASSLKQALNEAEKVKELPPPRDGS